MGSSGSDISEMPAWLARGEFKIDAADRGKAIMDAVIQIAFGSRGRLLQEGLQDAADFCLHGVAVLGGAHAQAAP